MAHTDSDAKDEKPHTGKDKDRSDGNNEGNDKAPGRESESGYPNDDYWDQGVRDKSKKPPAESPEPDKGYRWEPEP